MTDLVVVVGNEVIVAVPDSDFVAVDLQISFLVQEGPDTLVVAQNAGLVEDNALLEVGTGHYDAFLEVDCSTVDVVVRAADFEVVLQVQADQKAKLKIEFNNSEFCLMRLLDRSQNYSMDKNDKIWYKTSLKAAKGVS